MNFTRRETLILAASGILWPVFAHAESNPATDTLSKSARDALDRSPLVYVSPLRRDGKESRCHAEVWFAADGADALVVTSAKAWRARAIGLGLNRARLWVGDHGEWDRSGKTQAFRESPTFLAEASLDVSQATHDHALVLFGSKYTREWSDWGPRFKKGLADGSRVLIRYHAVEAQSNP